MPDNYPDGRTTGNDSELPSLYSKTLILVFAVLFSVIFAAVLLIINLRSLGKRKAAWIILLFSIIYLIFTAVMLQVFSLDPSLTFVFNVIGAAILNEVFWNRFIGKEAEFRKRGWIKPILIALMIAMAFFLLVLYSLPQ